MAASCGPRLAVAWGARPDRSRVRRGGGETAVPRLLCWPARGRLALGRLRLLPDAEHALRFSLHASGGGRLGRSCGGRARSTSRGLSVFAGLDLSESADLTALVLAHCDPRDGVWHVRPIFWLPE